MQNVSAFMKKVGAGIRKAYTGKYRFLVIGATCVVFLYAVYFAFCFRPEPSPGGKSNYWQDTRNVFFHILCASAILGLLLYGVFSLAKRTLSYRKAAVIIALMGAIFVSIYGLSTPIWDYGSVWNQHDLYYGSTNSRYYMEDLDILDGGGGHFGMIMTVFRHGILPEIKMVNGKYDFSFGGVLERYQPKLFYLISGFYMRVNTIFIPENTGIVTLGNAGTAYGLTNREWALFESLRLLYTMMEWLQIYFIYKIFVRLHFKKMPLLIAFSLAIFNPMWCYFANWANNDGMSTFFAIIGLYYALCYVQDGETYQVILVAVGVGCAMACKLGGALIAIVIAPLMLYRLFKAYKTTKKGERVHSKKLPELGYVTLQYLVFALIVVPLGLGFPIYSKIKFGQDIMFFSPVNNSSLYIVNENFAERFFLFPNADCFRMIWVYHSNKNAPTYIQDTSLLTALVKTSLYGEYGFGLSMIQCSMLYYETLLLIFAMMILLPYRFIRYIFRSSQRVEDPLRLYVFAAIVAVFYGWAVYFVNSYPHTCNEDMRYIPIIILALSGMVGSSFQSLEEHETVPVVKKIGQGTILSLSAAFVLIATFTYLTISPWYYR